MKSLKSFLMGVIWTVLVLTPFAVTVSLLKTEVQFVLLTFFAVHQIRHKKSGLFFSCVKYMMFLTIVFTSLSGVLYKILMFIKYDCFISACSGSTHVSSIAALMSLVTTLTFATLLLRRRGYFPNLISKIGALVDTAGVATLLIIILGRFGV